MFNRIQNPILQDKLHSLLGIKGAGSAAPTLSGEMVPVIVVGDVSQRESSPRFRRLFAGTVQFALTGTQNAWRFRFAIPGAVQQQLRFVLFEIATDAAGRGQVQLEGNDAAGVGNAFTGKQVEHRHSASQLQTIGTSDLLLQTGAIAGFTPMWTFLTDPTGPRQFRPADFVLAPDQAAQGFALVTVGTVSTLSNWIINLEWIEEPLDGVV